MQGRSDVGKASGEPARRGEGIEVRFEGGVTRGTE